MEPPSAARPGCSSRRSRAGPRSGRLAERSTTMASPRNPTAPRRSRRAHPPWLLLLLVIPVAAWITFSPLPAVDLAAPAIRRFCRDLGYAALAAMVLPYLYVWLGFLPQRLLGSVTGWMQWHIAAAYLAFALLVVHARGHLFRGALTSAIVILLAVVMLS